MTVACTSCRGDSDGNGDASGGRGGGECVGTRRGCGSVRGGSSSMERGGSDASSTRNGGTSNWKVVDRAAVVNRWEAQVVARV